MKRSDRAAAFWLLGSPSPASGFIVRRRLARYRFEATIPEHLILGLAGQPSTDYVGVTSLVHNSLHP